MEHRHIEQPMTRGVVTVPPTASFKTVADTLDGVVAVVDNLRSQVDDSHARPVDKAARELSEEWLRGL
ncbi:hypothetical protein ACH427_15610 [Streptomyces sp. NPDC020379]|uniref:hypothetical protein n=1 Tax=Streptomyces sp. NPDC020379 TaxID=3365071 RepID=UPI0037B59ABE